MKSAAGGDSLPLLRFSPSPESSITDLSNTPYSLRPDFWDDFILTLLAHLRVGHLEE